MSGRCHLPEEMKRYDFGKLAKKETNAKLRIRLLALHHLQGGKSYVEVSKIIQATRQTLSGWVRRYKREGLSGLNDKEGRGTKRKIAVTEEAAFKKAIIDLQAKRKGGRIRGMDIKDLMEKRFGIKCALSTVYNTLERANFVWISGRSCHPKSDIEKQIAYKKTSKK